MDGLCNERKITKMNWRMRSRYEGGKEAVRQGRGGV